MAASTTALRTTQRHWRRAPRLGRPAVKIDKGDSAAPAPGEVAQALDADPAISHVWVIHCETTSGIVNPIAAIARAVKARGKVFMVDAMSSFGALPLDIRIREQTDGGTPTVVAEPSGAIAAIYRDIARRTALQLARLQVSAPARGPVISFSND